ncbi:MAG: ABC transporter substrate-binding protein [Deltaproteobacteria bacterium]|nr:ABC transporter substrate-binding protein [Deltaproteobacteria bacterium]
MKKSFIISLTIILVGILVIGFSSNPTIAAEKDRYGGILKVAEGKTPIAFGYPIKVRASDQSMACEAMETLVKTNLEAVVEPNLATGWEVTPDGKTYTFKLRKGVKFHDGSDFNAQAAKYNLDIWINNPAPAFTKLTSADVINDYTIRLNFSKFDNLVLYELSTEAYMASPTAIEKNGVKWAETNPVGTGPFKLKSYERAVAVRYERFNDYWKEGRPYADGLEFVIIKNSMTQMAALKAGEINIIGNVNYEHARLLEKEGYKTLLYPSLHIAIFGDSKNPKSPWSKKKVREAIEYAIDKEGISEMSYGIWKPLYQMVRPDHPFYNPNLKQRKYDPDKSRKLLAEAGYPNGLKTTFTFMNRHWPESWTAMQGSMAKAGIDLKLAPVDRPKYVMLAKKGGLKNNSTHMQLPMIPDPIYGIKNFLISTAPIMPDMARPAGFDDLVNKLLMAKDLETKKTVVNKINKMVVDEVMYIPLGDKTRVMVFNESVQNYEKFNYYTGPFVPRYGDMWLSKK